MTVAENKGGWLGTVVHEFPSTMAQNFWIAIFAWSTCFVVTILLSVLTKPRPDSELEGLVYGLTRIPYDAELPWYKRPLPLAAIVVVALLILNLRLW